jgi:hypothetical protein
VDCQLVVEEEKEEEDNTLVDLNDNTLVDRFDDFVAMEEHSVDHGAVGMVGAVEKEKDGVEGPPSVDCQLVVLEEKEEEDNTLVDLNDNTLVDRFASHLVSTEFSPNNDGVYKSLVENQTSTSSSSFGGANLGPSIHCNLPCSSGEVTSSAKSIKGGIRSVLGEEIVGATMGVDGSVQTGLQSSSSSTSSSITVTPGQKRRLKRGRGYALV